MDDRVGVLERELERVGAVARAKEQEVAGWEAKFRQVVVERDQLRIRT